MLSMILRYTGANQSLILEGILPLIEQVSTGADVLNQGIDVEPISIPLHRVRLHHYLLWDTFAP